MDVQGGLRPGDVLEHRYRLLQVLGQGGMGRVFVAEDLRLAGKRWAIKETVPPIGDASGFLREAELLARLQHPMLPQIVDYYGPSERNRCAYVVMELISGVTLDAELQHRGGRLPAATIVRIGSQLCEALVYLHGQKPEPIVFRDIKPSNIMLDEKGRVRLIDFGIARRFKPEQPGDTLPLGSVGFAAPEQLRGERTDPRSDLYSLGAVLYFLLSGGQYAALRSGPLAVHCTHAPEPLLRLVERLLEQAPEHRPQHAAEVLDALRALELKPRLESMGGAAAAEMSVRSEPRLMLVGGLYRGAGATFAAVCLAKALAQAGVDHAVAEHPVIEPELYALLDGERRAPQGYAFANERSAADMTAPATVWIEGYTEWVASRPGAEADDWTAEQTERWLGTIRRSVVIVDIGDRWRHPAVATMCDAAAGLLVVADPSPSKLSRSQVQALLRELDGLARRGVPVTWVANRDAPSPRRGDWLRMLPAMPAISLPAFAPQRMLEAQWLGDVVPAADEAGKAAAAAFAAFVQRAFPRGITASGPRRKSIWPPMRRSGSR
ncbi:serine/threonine-protein kinase [Gordoniibacillus kamchatkensis]|uniref:serine/threonine-protein kinase n=1 Tax=Gordoniibacillus kamchatkensis TaxID=1590651 RepID=UPI0006964F37|nr:serine/threonine-protein kinase [Paenibacillus sp. VKM B-2647]